MAHLQREEAKKYMLEGISKRYLRIEEIADLWDMEQEVCMTYLRAAGAVIKLPRTTLIHKERTVKFMKHLYKVPETNKYVQKKFVRIGEGSIIYSIGRQRFVEMARAARAVYKFNGGGTVLVNLDLFDEYMEQFRINAIPMKHPLYAGRSGQ